VVASPTNGKPVKRAGVRSSLFEPLGIAPLPGFPPAAISVNYRMAFDFNRIPDDNFAVHYLLWAGDGAARESASGQLPS